MRSLPRNQTRLRTIPAAMILGGIAVTAAACGGSARSATPSTSPTTSPAGATQAATFGPDCGMVPASGMGSLHSMSMDPVVQAAAHNPLLTTLATDAATAGLTAQLDAMPAITVFAPSNDAFTSLPTPETGMMHSRAELAKILRYHVVDGRITPAEFQTNTAPKTLEGSTIELAKMGSTYEVNRAAVICGNIQTANATVYIINQVLTPMH